MKAERVTAILILRALREHFIGGLISGGIVTPMSAEELTEAVEEYDSEAKDARDAESIRKTIDRLRDEFVETIRKTTGKPIGEYDIIENVSRTGAMKGAKGYRLNPRTVSLGAPTT